MPVKVRAVAVPPRVRLLPGCAVSVPSATASVTVRVALSGSAKGVPKKRIGPAVSSVKAKLAGRETVWTEMRSFQPAVPRLAAAAKVQSGWGPGLLPKPISGALVGARAPWLFQARTVCGGPEERLWTWKLP